MPSISNTGAATVSIESLVCNDGDFVLTITAVAGNVVQGTCWDGCTFRMTKR